MHKKQIHRFTPHMRGFLCSIFSLDKQQINTNLYHEDHKDLRIKIENHIIFYSAIGTDIFGM